MSPARPVVPDLPPCGGAFAEATPARLACAAALAGVPARPFRRILLAECGTGTGVAILAAALAGTGAEVTGATSDPQQAAAARALLAEAELEAPVLDAGPEALAEATEGAFDLVLLPWGWDLMTEPAREAFADFLDARLAPGGALFLIHETPPGDWAEATLRALLANRRAALPGAGAKETLEALREMMPACHALIRGMPRWDARLDAIAALPEDLIARLWLAPRPPVWPMRRIGAWAARAGLAFWAPADPARLVREADYTPQQLSLIDAAPDLWTAQETADLLAARRIRADLFLRPGGPRPDPGALRLRAAPGAAERRLTLQGLLGPTHLARSFHLPLITAAAGPAGGSARLSDLCAGLGLDPATAAARAAALIGAGALLPETDLCGGAPALAASARLNALLLRERPGVPLASPSLGGGWDPSAEGRAALARAAAPAPADPAA